VTDLDGITPATLTFHARNTVDFDLSSASENSLGCGSNGATFWKELSIDLIHRVKILEICKMDADLDNVGKIAAGGLEYGAHVGEFKPRLPGNIAELELLGNRVDGSLTRDKDKSAGNHGVGVRTERPGEAGRRDDLSIAAKDGSRVGSVGRGLGLCGDESG
jgi:hypothetical protein